MAGKGDSYRPVKKKVFDTNFDEIKWQSKNKTENVTIKGEQESE